MDYHGLNFIRKKLCDLVDRLNRHARSRIIVEDVVQKLADGQPSVVISIQFVEQFTSEIPSTMFVRTIFPVDVTRNYEKWGIYLYIYISDIIYHYISI